MSQPHLITRAFDASLTDLEAGKRRVVATITTDAVDRYKEVILPGGLDLKGYLRNPVVLWAHNLEAAAPPIGRCLWIKPTRDGRGLVALTEFADTQAGNEVFGLYRDGFLKAFSVGVMPDREAYSRPTEKEVRARPELAGCTGIVRKGALVEYSACPIPVNPEALALAVGKGLIVPAAVRAAIAAAPPPPAPELPSLAGCRTFAQAHAALVRAARVRPAELARAAAADRLDLLRGRV